VECWPDDPDYIDGRVWIPSSSPDLEGVGCYFDTALLDNVGQPLSNQIDVSKDFQVRFRVEPWPRERWVDGRGDWAFDLAFSPIGSGTGFNLSSLLSPGMTLKDFQGDKTPCIQVDAKVPPNLLPGAGETYEVSATMRFQPASGAIAAISGIAPMESYSLLHSIPPPPPDKGRQPDVAPDTPSLSGTMQSVAEELSSAEVTAFDIARAIASRHPEYASGRLGAATLEAPHDTPHHEWKLWRDSVAQKYDRALVARSKHEVIDGRLFLVGLGLIDDSLRVALDGQGSWAALLLEVDEAVAPTGSALRSALQAVQFAYGYQGDVATGQDQLGVQGEVNAVCEVLTDPEVKPPLAVGLFGEWGAGKSFFMEKMRERVAELTIGPSRRKDLDVVQIRFNAWHYADTSLWASLAIEIFERLADPRANRGDCPRAVAPRPRRHKARGAGAVASATRDPPNREGGAG
jgi:hypothetical protein